MQNWVGVVIALAMVLQVSILVALFWQTRRTMQKVEKTVTDLNDRAGPILTRKIDRSEGIILVNDNCNNNFKN